MTAETKCRDGVGTQCTICGGDRWRFVRKGRDLHRADAGGNFRLSQCLLCGHVMQTPIPTDDELSAAYSVDYVPYRPAWKESRWPLWRILREVTTRRRMLRLKRYGRGRKLLEIGSGAGDFLYAAHRAGWEVKAVEYSDKLANSLRTELGFDVRPGELTPGLWKEGEFDLIIAWSVLEHVRNPLDMLVTASSYLKAGGLIFFQIPTLYGIERGKWFGDYWALLDLPRHINFFSKESLSRLCCDAGMDLIVFKTPTLETLWCYFTSSCNYINDAKSLLRRLLRSVSVGIKAPLALPYLVSQAWHSRGTEAFAIAVKSQR